MTLRHHYMTFGETSSQQTTPWAALGLIGFGLLAISLAIRWA